MILVSIKEAAVVLLGFVRPPVHPFSSCGVCVCGVAPPPAAHHSLRVDALCHLVRRSTRVVSVSPKSASKSCH